MTEGFALEKYIWTLRYEIKYGDVAYKELRCMLQLKKIHEDRIHIIYALQFFFKSKAVISMLLYDIFQFFQVIGPITFCDYYKVTDVCLDKFKSTEHFVHFLLEVVAGVAHPHC